MCLCVMIFRDINLIINHSVEHDAGWLSVFAEAKRPSDIRIKLCPFAPWRSDI